MALYGSKSANYDHRQVYFADGAVSPTDKRNMSSPLDNEVHNFTQIATKLTDVMLSTNQHNRGLSDQYNLSSSDQIIMEDHQFNGRSPDQYTRGRSPEQYNRGRSQDRNTPNLNAYRSATPPLS